MKAERARFPIEREEERGLNRAALTRWGKASVPSRRILRGPSYHGKKMLSKRNASFTMKKLFAIIVHSFQMGGGKNERWRH